MFYLDSVKIRLLTILWTFFGKGKRKKGTIVHIIKVKVVTINNCAAMCQLTFTIISKLLDKGL